VYCVIGKKNYNHFERNKSCVMFCNEGFVIKETCVLKHYTFVQVKSLVPMSVAARSKAWVCGR
jgi:hypothetical protein